MRKKTERGVLILAMLLALSTLCRGAQSQPQAETPASHKEIESIGSTPETKFRKLVTFCLDKSGNLLACDAGAESIRKIGPDGKTLGEWELDFTPYAVDASRDGAVYVAGQGLVAKLNGKGDLIKEIRSDGENFPSGKPSGITTTEEDVFIGVGSGWSLRSKSSIVRFDRNLEAPKVIAEDLRGCCQRLDLAAKDKVVYIAENTRYRVVRCDRDGKILSTWGSKSRIDIEGFGSCCNPMNLCFGPKGELYTAESGLGRIKRYTPEGKYLGLVGYVGTDRFNRAGRFAASCSNITVAVNKDASRIYVLDFKNNMIRVMAKADVQATP